MHIGTGWYCWRANEDRQLERSPKAPGSFRAALSPRHMQLVDRAVELYARWKDADDREAIRFLQRNLREGRAAVVHEFLRRMQADEEIGRFLKDLTRTEEWRRWSRGLAEATRENPG
jgi:hypothetical protein